MGRLPGRLSKIALLRAGRIGDILCATPAFRALRKAWPDAEITMITLPMLRDLVERSPHLDRYAEFPGYPGLAEQFFDARKALNFFREMQAERFDLAMQMQGSGVYSNPFCLMLGARATVGFIRPGDSPGSLDAALPIPESGHEVERVLALVEYIGVPRQGVDTEFNLWPEDHAVAEKVLASATPPWIGLHPAARERTRRWPLERFMVAGAALQRIQGGTLVVLGESEGRAEAARLVEGCEVPALNLAGLTSLPVLGATIARLSVLVTNDTGPAHIAYALGTPTVTVFGGGDLRRYGALQSGPFRMVSHPVPCRPCDYTECPIGDACLRQLSVEQVVENALEVGF